MTEASQNSTPPLPPATSPQTGGPGAQRGTDMLLLTYICYLLALVIGVTGIVGLVLAYLQRPEVAGTWRESHYTWLIRTFWIGLLFVVIGCVTTVIAIGFIILFATFVWYVVRLVKGWVAYSKEQPIADPENWFFG